MRSVTRENLIKTYRTRGKKVPDMIEQAERGTEFVYGFNPTYGGTVALHRADKKPTHVFNGISIFPILPGAPGTIEIPKTKKKKSRTRAK